MTAPALLTPLQIGPLTARNRLWLPPMCMYSVEARDGVATDWHVLHYGTRAVGGFGTVIVEATAVSPEGRLSEFDLGLWDDAQVEGHRRIVKAIHDGGALAGVQLGHGGRKAGTPPWRPDVKGARAGTLEGWDLVAPSAIPYPSEGHAVPRELDEAGIARLVEAFGQAARRAIHAGYDLIEIHGAHGYLIHQFLSPLSNTRADAFGGDEEGRRRFPLQVVAAVRRAIDDAGQGSAGRDGAGSAPRSASACRPPTGPTGASPGRRPRPSRSSSRRPASTPSTSRPVGTSRPKSRWARATRCPALPRRAPLSPLRRPTAGRARASSSPPWGSSSQRSRPRRS